MPNASEISSKIAEESIKAMTGQIDFVNGLGLAVIGGVFAFALQVILHNRGENAVKVTLKYPSLLHLSVGLQTLTLIVGTLAKGSLAEAIPAIVRFDFSAVASLSHATFLNASQIAHLAAWQSYTFLAGVALLALFLVVNRRLIK